VAPKNTPERRPSPDRPVSRITLTSCDVGHGLRRYSLRLKYHHPLRSSIPGMSVASRAMTVDIIKRKMKLARVSRQHFQAYMNPPCEPGAETIPANRVGKSPESWHLAGAVPRQIALLRALIRSGGSDHRSLPK